MVVRPTGLATLYFNPGMMASNQTILAKGFFSLGSRQTEDNRKVVSPGTVMKFTRVHHAATTLTCLHLCERDDELLCRYIDCSPALTCKTERALSAWVTWYTMHSPPSRC